MGPPGTVARDVGSGGLDEPSCVLSRRRVVPVRGDSALARERVQRQIKQLDEKDGIKYRTIAERLANQRVASVFATPNEPEPDKPQAGILLSQDATFHQTTAHFFGREYWINPINLLEPFDDNAQPPQESWQDITLEKLASQVNRLDRRSIMTTTTISNVSTMADEIELVRAARDEQWRKFWKR